MADNVLEKSTGEMGKVVVSTGNFQSSCNQSQTTGRNCLFKSNGCLQIFASLEESFNHAENCFYGVFQVCTSPSCLEKPCVMQPSPKALLNHAVSNHGCILSQINLANSIRLILPIKYCYPKRVTVRFLRKYTLRADNTEYEIALVMIIMPDEEGTEEDAKVIIAAVQLMPRWDPSGSSAHLIELAVCLNDHDGNRIPRLPSKSSETTQQLMMAATVNGFTSPQDFYNNFNSVKVASYSRNAILQQGGANAVIQRLSLIITTKLTVHRCSIMGYAISSLQPYAGCWEDLGLSDQLREAIHGKYAESPQSVAKVVVPQMKDKKDVMIECGTEKVAMEALILGILLNLTPTSRPPSPLATSTPLSQPQTSTHCKVLALFPSSRSITVAAKQWMDMVNASNLTCKAITISEQFGKSHVILTSMNALASMMTDLKLWSLLTNNLEFLHLHAPGRLIATAGDTLKAFVNKLGVQKMNQITKTAFDLDLTTSVQLSLSLFQNQPLVLKIGNDLTPLIHEYITTSTSIPVSDGKSLQLCRFLNRFTNNNKRWLIFVEHENLESVAMTLRSRFAGERISIFRSEENIRDSHNFFEIFQKTTNGILLAPLSALDYEELYKVDRIILYNYPKLKADILRICMAVKQPFSWSTKPVIFWFQ